MNFDFLLILSALTLFSGIIALIDIIWWQKARAIGEKQPIVVEYSRSFFPVFIIVLIIRSFIGQIFHVPTGSLSPTVLPGDFILVTQYDYGLRMPIWHTKFISVGNPHHGDIVVFRWPVNQNVNFVKRLIGEPGDSVSYIDNVLYINGKKMPQTFVGYASDNDGDKTKSWSVKVMEEDFMGIKHKIYLCADVKTCPSTTPNFYNVVVPKGEYLMMGDNRDNSDDGRGWGFVPNADIDGKGQFILFSPSGWGRIGNKL